MNRKRKNRWKKRLSVVLATVMTFSTFPIRQENFVPVQAATEDGTDGGGDSVSSETGSSMVLSVTSGAICGPNATYSLDSDGVLTFNGSGEVTEVFSKYENIREVTVAENCNITGLPKKCFQNCSGITTVNLSKMSLLTELPLNCFEGCESLASIIMPEQISILRSYCFASCISLSEIMIPETITSIGGYCFQGCSSLNHVYYPGSKAEWEKMTGTDNSNVALLNPALMNAQKHYGVYTLTYDYSTNGGNSAAKENEEVKANSNIDLINSSGDMGVTAVKTGWEFVGWNTNQSAKEALASLEIKESDITLYAVFKKVLTASFVDSRQMEEDLKEITVSGDIYNAETAVDILAPELTDKAGWTAVGWSASKDSMDTVIKPGEKISISENANYYAVYKQEVTVHYAADGVTGVVLPEDLTETRYCIDNQVIENPAFTLADAVNRTGYVFSSWQRGSDSTEHNAGAKITVGNEKTEETFTASWTARKAVAPVITTQPADVTAAYGYQNKSMQIQVTADAGAVYELSYQWYENTSDSTVGGIEVSGANSLKLSLEEGKSAGRSYYYCVVTATRQDNGQTSTVTSVPAAFTVEKAERTIVIDSLDKTFDNMAVGQPAYKVMDKAAGTELGGVTGTVSITYYKDNNGSAGTKLTSAPSAVGTYWVQVTIGEEENYQEVFGEKKFVISYLETPETPYIIEKADGVTEKNGWYTGTVMIKPAAGYEIAEDSYANTFSADGLEVSDEGEHTITIYLKSILGDTDGQITDKISVLVNIDKTEPTGTIQLGTNYWKSFVNDITFGLFFKETQSITISAEDEGSGIGTISYFISSEGKTEEEVKAITDWTGYSETLSLNPEAKYIVYARITDRAGNTGYLSSDGLVFDNTAPVFKGITNGEEYYGDVTFEVEDNYLKSIRLDGVDLLEQSFINDECTISSEGNDYTVVKVSDNKYTIKAGINKKYSFVAADRAGNSTIMTISVFDNYTVTFTEDSSGTVQEFAKQTVKFDQKASEPTSVPVKTGYVFAGWAESSSDSNFDFNTPITADLTLVAKWIPAVYTVSFDSRGGALCTDMAVTYGQSFGTMPITTRDGYEFDGWYTTTGADKAADILGEYDGDISVPGKVTDTTMVKITGKITLYAHWTAKTYKVTFMGENGMIIPPEGVSSEVFDAAGNTLKVTYNMTYNTLPTAERAGYDFLGWYTDKISGDKIEADTIYENAKDTTLYAHWTESRFEITLNYNYKGYSSTTAAGEQPEDEKIQVIYNDTYDTLPKMEPTRAGYTFDGWYDAETGGVEITKDSKVKITENSTLYAHWTANSYEISFDVDGGSDCQMQTVTYDGTYGILPVTVKQGYSFLGWYLLAETEIDKKIEEDSIVEITGDAVLTAKWAANNYTVTLDPNGGTLAFGDSADDTIKVTYGLNYSELMGKEAERTGYTFAGWYTERDGGSKTEAGSMVEVTEDITLYAHWTANTYTIRFNADGGSGCEEQTVVYNNSYGSLPTTQKAGHQFEGWYILSESGDKEDTRIEADSKVEITEDTVLTAKWSAKQYTVTLEPNGGVLSSEDSLGNTIRVIYGLTWSELAGKTADRTGYTFAGWYTEAVAGSLIEESSSVEITEDTTIYAHWSANALAFTGDTLAPAVYKKDYRAEFTGASGGTGSYRYELADGSSLPDGLSLSGNTIQGTLNENVQSTPFSFDIIATDENSGVSAAAAFSIQSVNAEQAAPSAPELLSRTSTSITLKKISSIASVVYSNDGINWQESTEFTGLQPGVEYTFYAKLAARDNYNESQPSDAAKITTLHVYTVTLPSAEEQSANHYTITSVPDSGDISVEEGGSYTFQLQIQEGYGKKDSFAVIVESRNGDQVTESKAALNSDGSCTIRNIRADKNIRVEGIKDITCPAGTITIEKSNWSFFVKNITFGLFFKAAPTVAIQGSDVGAGVAEISYYIADENEILTEAEVRKGGFNWQTVNGDIAEISVDREGKSLIYAKITDLEGNSTYIRSDGIVVDKTAPVIGLSESEYVAVTEVTFDVQDENLSSVTLDGKAIYPFAGKYSVPADNVLHSIVAGDAAGNTSTVSVRVSIPTYTVKFLSEGSIWQEKTVEHNQTAEIPEMPTKNDLIFAGWYLEGEEFDFNTPITGDITLEADWVDAGSPLVSQPVALKISGTRVILKQEEGCKYRMNHGEITEAPVFSGLIPGNTYYFYQVDEKGVQSIPLKITTPAVSRYGMMALPSTLYQGEFYEVSPTITMEGLINASVEPESTSINWSVSRPDIVSVSNGSNTGCTLCVNQVPYQKNRISKVTLTAKVSYVQIRGVEPVNKTRTFRTSFYVQNLTNTISIDVSDMSKEPASTGAFVSGGAVYLMDKTKVTLKTILNGGVETDVATNQKLKWFVSDENGKVNAKGRKIVSISNKGVLRGLKPGITYITVAALDSYNKTSKTYGVFTTCKIICPWVEEISFNSDMAATVKAGDTMELSSALNYNPTDVFNKEKMSIRWKSSDTRIASVTQKGKVTFKKAGTVTITCTPTGGLPVDAATGKVSEEAKDKKAEITFTVE